LTQFLSIVFLIIQSQLMKQAWHAEADMSAET
jgi:hypothetical protein